MTPQENLTPFKRLLRLLKTDRRDLSQIYIYSVFIGLLNLTLPLGIQAIINFIQMGEVSTSWILLVSLVVGAIMLGGILQIYQLRITENLQQKIFIRSAFEFAYRIPRFRFDSLRRQFAPELVNRFFDTMTIQKGLPKLLIDFSTALLQLFFGLILLSVYHPFFIIFSLVLLMILIPMLYFTGKRGLSTAISESKYKYKVAFWLEELARTMHTFKLAGKSDLPLEKTNAFTEAYIRERESHYKVLYLQFAQLVGFKTVTAFFLLIIGGLLVLNQEMNIGQFVAAEIIILLVISSVEKLILNIENLYDVLAAIDKLAQVTDIGLEPEGGNAACTPDAGPMAVEMQNVNFSYHTDSRLIFSDFNLSVGAGQHTAIYGSEGSGKTTLLHLIGQLYAADSGSISYNRFPSNGLNLAELRSMIGDIVSEQQLFPGTLEENITMNRPGITQTQLVEVCEQIHLMDDIVAMPDGFATAVEPGTRLFSRSLYRKIILARCLINQPKLLLLDDQQHWSENRHQDYDHLVKLLFADDASWTLIAATNNEAWLPHFKQIMVLEKGKIVFTGTYAAFRKVYPVKLKP